MATLYSNEADVTKIKEHDLKMAPSWFNNGKMAAKTGKPLEQTLAMSLWV